MYRFILLPLVLLVSFCVRFSHSRVFEWVVWELCLQKVVEAKPLSKRSSSRTSKGAWDENLPINPPIQPPSIPKAPAKTFIDGIPFNVFQAKFCRDQYTKVYPQRSLVIERQLYLDFFLNIPILDLFVKLGWLSLETITGIACAPIVQMFYLNIIEHDLDESYL